MQKNPKSGSLDLKFQPLPVYNQPQTIARGIRGVAHKDNTGFIRAQVLAVMTDVWWIASLLYPIQTSPAPGDRSQSRSPGPWTRQALVT